MPSEQPSIPVGYVRRAHGIGGDVVVRGMVTDAGDRFVPGSSLTTGEVPSRTFEIVGAKAHQGDYLITLAGISSRTDAEALVGTQFTIPLDERRTLDEGEWWVDDLVGCRVVDLDGSDIGVVESLATGAAQDRLVVRPPDGELFDVPFVDALVPSVDIESRIIVADLPEGLAG